MSLTKEGIERIMVAFEKRIYAESKNPQVQSRAAAYRARLLAELREVLEEEESAHRWDDFDSCPEMSCECPEK